ncbi:hypothetical protein KGY73_08490 [bacterium]|nr:hypothetical protein [bacterium]
MKCKKTEKWILRSFDKKLTKEQQGKLDLHIQACPSCEQKQRDYQKLLDTLRYQSFPDPKPYFWERLKPKLLQQEKYEAWSLWEKWGLRAIPLSILVVALFAAAVLLLFPPKQKSMSQSEILLIQNQIPFQKTRNLLEEEGWERKNLRLIFTSLEEQDKNGIRRYFP